MPDLSDSQGRLGLVVIVLVLGLAAYFVWTRSAPPVPQPAPGQTLQNPLGTPSPGPGGAPTAQPNAPVGPSPSAPFTRR
jgi:hypothetical protein